MGHGEKPCRRLYTSQETTSMKTIFAFLIVCLSLNLFAHDDQQQVYQEDLLEVSRDVMYEVGANPKLDPQILYYRVVDELGDVIKIEFRYHERIYGKRTCTYNYNTKINRVMYGSWLCQP